MKILVVDDSDFARGRIGKILRNGGHEVIEADNGEAALRLEEETQPQAITVDLLMPGMEGIELIRRLRARRPGLQIIAVSADVQKATRQEVQAAGASHFVAKTKLDETLLTVLQPGSQGLTPLLLSASQRDVFTEVMNIAMGQAAEALSVLLNRPVLLQVPEVEWMTNSGLTAFFREELVQVGVSIQQGFSGPLSGSAAMVFSTGQAAFLIRTLLGSEKEIGRLSVADQSVLTEMGNVVLNAVIAVLADQCDLRLKVSLPSVFLNQEGDSAARLLLEAVSGADQALVLVSRLTIGKAELISYLVILMSEKDVLELLGRIASDNKS